MTLAIHICIAIAGVIAGSYGVIRPSLAGLYATLGLIAGTLLSGAYLIISVHAAVLHTCISGLIYAVIVSGLAAVSYRRLAVVAERIR